MIFHGDTPKTADESDQASDLSAFFADIGIYQARQNAANISIINASGECLNCGFEVKHNGRFCDKECADEWEKYGE